MHSGKVKIIIFVEINLVGSQSVILEKQLKVKYTFLVKFFIW